MIWKYRNTATETEIQIGGVTYERRISLITLIRRYWPKKSRYRIAISLLILITVVFLGPFVYSRAMSASRALQVQTFDGVAEPATDLPDDSTVRIACYNIAHGRGLADSNWEGGSEQDRQTRLDDIAAMLREIDADVVVLNEIDFDASWSHSVDQAAYLAKRAGYPHVVTLRNLDFQVGLWRWQFGNAVLSRHPITHAHEIDLPSYAKWEAVLAGKKRALFCEIEIGDETLGLIAAHLSHRSEGLRASSAERLLAFVAGYGKPVVIAGDLNSAPTGFAGTQISSTGTNAIDVLDASGLYVRQPENDIADSSVYTFRSDRPSRVIDWILVPKQHELQHYEVKASLLSDHLPIVTDIRMDSTAEE